MRRTALRPGRVPLRTHTPLRRVAGLRAKRLRHVASNTPARREDLTPMKRELLWIRSGRCELCGVPLQYEQFQAAHRQARSQGGDNTALWNRWVACEKCHAWQHAHSDAAEETGHYIRSTGDPEHRPMCLPDGRIVRLGTAGTYEDVIG